MFKFLSTLIFTIFSLNLFGQDVLTLKTGEDIQVKVLEVTNSDVKYKKFDNQDGPSYTSPKAEIFSIKYQNGAKEVISEAAIAPKKEENLFVKGQLDAGKYYAKYKTAGTGTLITGLVSPLVGLIPAIACSSTEPKDENLGCPNPELLQNSEYNLGYKQKAKKIKSGKVWKNWGVALGANLITVLLLSAR